MRASDRLSRLATSQPFPTLCGEVGKRCARISLGVPNLPSLPSVSPCVRRRACVHVCGRAHPIARGYVRHQKNVGKVGKVGKNKQGQGFQLPTLCLRLGKGWEVSGEVDMASVDQVRVMFVRLAKWRVAQGDWTEADKGEASDSIKDAIDSGSSTRLQAVFDWLEADLVAVEAMTARVRDAVVRMKALNDEERAAREREGSARRQAAPVPAASSVVVRHGSRAVGRGANAPRGVGAVGGLHQDRRRA